MAHFCDRCGRALQDGETCNCVAAPQNTQAPVGAQPGAAPQQAPGYQPPPPPQGYQAQQPGQQPPPPGYQPGQPQQPVQPGQAQQAFGEFAGALGGFAKDPVGAAAKQHNPITALIFLAVQAVIYTIYYAVTLNKTWSDTMSYFGGRGSIFTFGDYMMGFLYVVIMIAAMLGCLYVMSLIVKIQIDPKALLSAMANASVPVSAAYVVMVFTTLIFGTTGTAGSFFETVLSGFGTAAGICLLEIGIRSQMPQGQGNVARLLTIGCSYAVTLGIGVLLYSPMLGNAGMAGLENWLSW